MARILVEGKDGHFGIFRRVGKTSVCYGGPFPGRNEAEEWRMSLEKQGDFVREEELNSRNFRLGPMKPNTDYLYWDGRSRSFLAQGEVVLSGRRAN